jgi:hypothetical protein
MLEVCPNIAAIVQNLTLWNRPLSKSYPNGSFHFVEILSIKYLGYKIVLSMADTLRSTRLCFREALAHRLAHLSEIQRSCLVAMDKPHQLDIEGHNSEEGNFCLRQCIGELPPTISEMLVKDDAFVYHMGKMIEEITWMASSCLSVRF